MSRQNRISKKIFSIVKSKVPNDIACDKINVWFQDEARVGQNGSLTRVWARKGTRPRVVKQHQFENAYIFGSSCPKRRLCRAIVSPLCNADAMRQHLEQISKCTKSDEFSVVIMDRAAWHKCLVDKAPPRVSIILLPAASPELNSMEQVWQWLKQHFLSNRAYESYDAIVDACCEAWNEFANAPDLIESICDREWSRMLH